MTPHERRDSVLFSPSLQLQVFVRFHAIIPICVCFQSQMSDDAGRRGHFLHISLNANYLCGQAASKKKKQTETDKRKIEVNILANKLPGTL